MFTGFHPEAIDFLWGIKLNNRRDWFLEHKQQYLDALYEPMKALGEAVYEPFQMTPGMQLHVSRIYRDARYAHGLPYKDSLWLSIRNDDGYWAELPCLYFDLHPDYYGYGFGVVSPRTEAMQRFRERIAGRPDEFLKLAADMKRATGFEVSGDRYKRKPPCPDPRLEPYFSLKNIFCLTEKPIGPELYEPALAETVGEAFQKLMPLYTYCQKITNV